MHPPEHTPFRQLIEPYFNQQRVAWFKPLCRGIADSLAASLQGQQQVELMADFALPFALRAQCAFMGWSQDLQQPLLDWLKQSQAASRNQDRWRIWRRFLLSWWLNSWRSVVRHRATSQPTSPMN